MYDERMQRAFASLQHHCPKGFSVDLLDNNEFITVRMDSKKLLRLSDFEKRRAVEYVARVKNAFEDLGAIVLVTRTPIDDLPSL